MALCPGTRLNIHWFYENLKKVIIIRMQSIFHAFEIFESNYCAIAYIQHRAQQQLYIPIYRFFTRIQKTRHVYDFIHNCGIRGKHSSLLLFDRAPALDEDNE